MDKVVRTPEDKGMLADDLQVDRERLARVCERYGVARLQGPGRSLGATLSCLPALGVS